MLYSYPLRRIDKYKKLLKLSMSKLHKKLGYVAPRTGDEAADKKKHVGEQQYLQAKKHDNHTLNTQDEQSCLHKVSSVHLISLFSAHFL